MSDLKLEALGQMVDFVDEAETKPNLLQALHDLSNLFRLQSFGWLVMWVTVIGLRDLLGVLPMLIVVSYPLVDVAPWTSKRSDRRIDDNCLADCSVLIVAARKMILGIQQSALWLYKVLHHCSVRVQPTWIHL